MWLVAGTIVALGVSGCAASSAQAAQSSRPTSAQSAGPSATSTAEAPARVACEGALIELQVSSNDLTSGETVEVSTTPEHCLVTKEWAGDIIVRLENGNPDVSPDTSTGVRIEAGTSQPVTVKIPAGLEGVGYIMLEQDLNCEDLFHQVHADCYFPYADVTIEASGG
jgi:hypothetical protein